ncbi:MAG: hypothetical protein IJM90_01075 [Firmicutes bacterium]|nr:hypothetical protein [Bacillota bacterium]
MDTLGIIFIVVLSVAAVLVGLYFLGRHLQKKQDESQKMINQNRQVVQAYVIDKKKLKMSEANFPKAAMGQLPWYLKNRKLPMAKVKIGPQILTMLVDGKVFKDLPTKKNLKLEVSGAYILGYNTSKKGEKKPEQPPRKLTLREKLQARLDSLRKGKKK